MSKTPLGQAGFKAITYHGIPVHHIRVDESPALVGFDHMYLGGFASFMTKRPSQGRHVCLSMGYWCWQNFREHPTDIVPYLRIKLHESWLIP